jgi:hypothetical protein
LFRSYGSILPTSLTYIVLSTRGCAPWRPAAVISTTGCEDVRPQAFHGPSGVRRREPQVLPSSGAAATSPGNPIPWPRAAVRQKRKLFPRRPPASPGSVALPPGPTRRYRNLDRFPFRGERALRCPLGASLPLRIDLPRANCCSPGTLLHFSLQSSHLNICYYHQDLH